MTATHGIDVSEWQGRIDWPTVRADGIDFAVIRAGYGLAHPDPMFAANWKAAGAAGVQRAAYLWLRASQPARAQAAYLAGAMGPLDAADADPWCDFETADKMPAAVALGALADFCDELEQRTGRVPVIYTGPSFWRSLGTRTGAFGRYPLAIAEYGVAAPHVPAPWSTWTYWQHTSAGNVPGIPGRVDLDLSTVGAVTAAPANPEEHPHKMLNAPVVAVVINPAGPGYWQVGADGGVFAWGGAPGIDNQGLPGMKLNAPIVDAAATPTGHGLYLTAADGGIFALGDAAFAGSASQL